MKTYAPKGLPHCYFTLRLWQVLERKLLSVCVGRTSNASERSNESSQHGEKTEPHLKGSSSRRNKKDTKDRKGKKKDFIKRNIMVIVLKQTVDYSSQEFFISSNVLSREEKGREV